MTENIRLALYSIVNHRMRSLLTMLGIIVGIASIISIFSIINGNTANMKKQMIGGQTNSMQIEYGSRNKFISGNSSSKDKKPDYAPIVEERDLKRVSLIDDVTDASLFYQGNLPVFFKDSKADAIIIGVDQHFFNILPHITLQGRMFSKKEFQSEKQVCLITKELFDVLLPYSDLKEKLIEINGIPFRILGVIESKTDQMIGKNIFISSKNQSIVESKLNQHPIVLIKTKNADSLENATSKAAKQLTKLIPPSDYVFSIKNYDDVKKMTDEFNKSNIILLGGIASISLFVGGIGVMNTMIVSVTERTREIGLKKAIGATQKIILTQFLTEATVLSLVGGALGITIGVIISYVVVHLLNYPFELSLFSIVMSVSFSIIIGIVFGFLPAYRASKLKPIDALRYE